MTPCPLRYTEMLLSFGDRVDLPGNLVGWFTHGAGLQTDMDQQVFARCPAAGDEQLVNAQPGSFSGAGR